MTRTRFVSERKPGWQKLEALLRGFERRRLRRIEGQEVSDLSELLRSTAHDLATVRSREWGPELERFLNDLVLRGHNLFYRSPPGRIRHALHFLSSGFPRLLRENRGYFWAALALFVIPGLISGVLVSVRPELTSYILSSDQQEMMDQMYSQSHESRGSSGRESTMAGFYVYNNVGIAFRCFATGVLFGMGTIFFLVYNSIAIGTITGFLVARGRSEAFFSFVISHGSFELTAIVISGAAGLVLGHSIVHPGQRERGESLRVRGRDAVKLAAGAGVMLGIAALIEAFWSPSGVPDAFKYAVGGILWAVVIWYLAFAGRERETGGIR